MGQVISNIVRCICGEAEKDDPEWPIEHNLSPPNRPLLFTSCASDTFIHTKQTSSLSSHSHSDSSPIGTWINPFKMDPHGDTFTIGSLHQNPTPDSFPQIVWDSQGSNSSPSSTLDHESRLESLSDLSLIDPLVLTYSPSFESLSELSSIEEEEIQVSPFQSEVNSIKPREEENVDKGVVIKETWVNSIIEPREEKKINKGVVKKEKWRNSIIEPREEEKINKGVVIKEIWMIKERWMNDYCNRHKILLVGEGDFSFSASLALAFGFAPNIIATSLNSTGYLRENYSRAMSNIKELTSRGCKVVHGVDATEMTNHLLLKGMKFDRIVFNFPLAGFFPDISRKSELRRHRKLVELFLVNAKKMITAKGEIHVRHKSNGFFRTWNLELLGSIQGLRLIEEGHFNFTDYPGYHTKYGFWSDKNFNCNPSKTYKFGLP